MWLVDDLDHDRRELTVRLVPRMGSSKRSDESVLVPIEALVEGVAELQERPELPAFFQESTVSRLLKVGKPGQGIARVTLATVNGDVGPLQPLSDRLLSNGRDAVRPADESAGSVVGRLDIMNARAERKLRVSLFDSASRRAITGYASAALREQVLLHFEHRVLAEGLVTRNERGQIVKIQIERLQRLPDDDSQRASVEQVFGADPEWLGGRDVDEFLREARRG